IAHRSNRQAGDDDLANVVNLRMGRGVDLENVDVAAFSDLDAGVADSAWIGRLAVNAIQRPSEDAGGRGFPDASRSSKHERLSESAPCQGVAKRACDRLLADDVVEPLRPPLASENLIRHQQLKG